MCEGGSVVLRLYHGSYTPVEYPDLNKCVTGKDFGRGFYLTPDYNQARSFIKTSIAKARGSGVIPPFHTTGAVSTFEYPSTPDLNVLLFDTVSTEWLRCVTAHRVGEGMSLPYDLVVGKIADDNTNRTLLLYLNGVFGEPGSQEAMEGVVKALLPNRLSNQYCFRTPRALQCLQFVEVTYYDVKNC